MRPTLAVSASAATLAPTQTEVPRLDKLPATHLPVTHTDGHLSAGGYAFLRDLSPSFSVNTEAAPSAGIILGLEASDGRPTSAEETTLGRLACSRFLACARIKIYWMTPEWGSRADELPPETQFLLLQLSPTGPYAILLPLIDCAKFRATLRPPRKGKDSSRDVRLRVESGDESVAASHWGGVLLVAAGTDPYDLVDSAVAAAAQLSGGAKPRLSKQQPDFVGSFGWCTWDAFYSQVSAKGIDEGLQALKEGGVPPRLLIVDDGWQSTDLDPDLRPPPSEALQSEHEVLMAAAKVTSAKKVGTPFDELVNQATVLESGAALPQTEPAAIAKPAEQKKGVLITTWDRIQGFFTGILVAIIATLYMWFIEHAPPDSRRIRWFTRQSKGKFRTTILHFYAQTSDHVKRLTSVKANGKFSAPDAAMDAPLARPEGLAVVVADLRDRFGLKHVFCWHSLYGYWAGIAPDAPEMAAYDPQLVWPQPTQGVLDVDPCFAWNCQVVAGVGVVRDIRHLYHDMHTYLAGAGIDGVKVDCQSTLDMIGSSLGGGPALAAGYHAALEDSVAAHFPGNACINCMCHSTSDIYRMADTALARSSDDFWPRDPASHTTHVAVNALNSLFMSPLVQPDWDMFHSQHPAALMHARARVVSGGPVYVSDRPGAHDFDLLKRCVLPDGTVLLAAQPGRPTADCLFVDVMRDSRSLLKVWTTNASGSGLIGIFNVQGSHWSRVNRQFVTHNNAPQTLTTEVRPADVPAFAAAATAADDGCAAATRYVMYSDAEKKAWVVDAAGKVSVRLSRGQSDLITVVPLNEVKGLCIAPIGLTDMLNTGASVQRFSCGAAAGANGSQGIHANAFVRGCGRLLLYSTCAPSSCTVDGASVNFEFDAEQKSLSLMVPRNDSLLSAVCLDFALAA
ncbi:probable galactinol-sucrose galactosyltransferase 2 [Coccomyxa sp. Obi]|nr:probable galactinol-sucrose galactosyltransferase 2 [Coccomyxa sp. Obi]